MTSRHSVSLLWILPLGIASLFAQSTPTLSQTVATYCKGCHNGSMRSPSGVLLDRFDAARIAEDPQVWAKAYRQLQAGAMPPVGAPRPNRAVYDAALVEIEKAWGASKSAAADDEMAKKLASMLWDGEPDAALLEDARRGRLRDAAVRVQHVKRMLADQRAQAFVTRFLIPWLQLNTITGDPAVETEMLLLSQLREDRDPLEVWTADYTFVNEGLAQRYGIEGVRGAEFRRVSLKPERRGLLGQASVLMATSREGTPFTTPATRAVWVRRHFFGINPPNPFPGAQPVNPELPITPQTRVLPQDPCVTCHRNFFPLGYALENFDTKGKWRTHDEGGPADASGAMVDGAKFNGVVEMRRALLERPDAFRTTIVEKLLVFAESASTGVMGGSPETLIHAREILRAMRQPRWSSIIAEVVAKQ